MCACANFLGWLVAWASTMLSSRAACDRRSDLPYEPHGHRIYGYLEVDTHHAMPRVRLRNCQVTRSAEDGIYWFEICQTNIRVPFVAAMKAFGSRSDRASCQTLLQLSCPGIVSAAAAKYEMWASFRYSSQWDQVQLTRLKTELECCRLTADGADDPTCCSTIAYMAALCIGHWIHPSKGEFATKCMDDQVDLCVDTVRAKLARAFQATWFSHVAELVRGGVAQSPEPVSDAIYSTQVYNDVVGAIVSGSCEQAAIVASHRSGRGPSIQDGRTGSYVRLVQCSRHVIANAAWLCVLASS